MYDIGKALILGDTHMHRGFLKRATRFAKENDCDAIIQVGDFGFWPRVKPNFAKYQTLPTFFIDGNHEDHDALKRYRNGINQIFPNVYYLNRGFVSLVGFANCMFVGGAYSIDKNLRTEGWDWFKEETLSEEEFDKIMEYKGEIDVLFCHDCPHDAVPHSKSYFPQGLPHRDKLQMIVDKFKPQYCIFGHWHLHERNFVKGVEYVCLDCNCSQDPNCLIFNFETKEIEEIVTL